MTEASTTLAVLLVVVTVGMAWTGVSLFFIHLRLCQMIDEIRKDKNIYVFNGNGDLPN